MNKSRSFLISAALGAVAFLLAGCASTAKSAPDEAVIPRVGGPMSMPPSYRGPASVDGAFPGARPAAANGHSSQEVKIVRLFYGTDRRRSGDAGPPDFYGTERSPRTNRIEYGLCHVTIPPTHQFGTLDSYSLLRFETRNVPERHVTVAALRTFERNQFLAEIQRAIEQSEGKELFVFIHGFNVTWEESARRCGQVAYDLGIDNKRGVPFLFSWPSQGRVSDYVSDDTNARVARADFREALELLAAHSGARHINILAHSMGNQIMADALDDIGRSPAVQAAPIFNQVVMAAPDVDIDDLINLSPNMRKAARKFTIYSSKADLPLRLSRWFRGDSKRVGSFAVIDGFDTIDGTGLQVEGLLKHNFADVPAILLDIRKLLKSGCSVQDRCCCCFKQVEDTHGKYWAFNEDVSPDCTHSNDCPSL